MRQALSKVALAMIALLLALALAEVASRAVAVVTLPHFTDDSGYPQRLLRRDPRLGKRTEADLHGWFVSSEYRTRIDTNADGFRMINDLTPDRRAGLRIVALGDSFTFGMGVEEGETFIVLLDQLLDANLAMGAEVLNLGVIGFGTLQEIELLRQYSFLKPDLIILAFFARDVFIASGGNDIEDNYFSSRRMNRAEAAPAPNARPRESLLRRIRLELLWRLNLVRMVELGLGGQLRKRYAPSDQPALREQAWRITDEALTRFDHELQAQHLQCVLLWIPFVATVASQDHSVARRLEALDLRQIVVVDVLDELRGQEEAAYYRLDGHWTARGHEVAARALLEPVLRATQHRTDPALAKH